MRVLVKETNGKTHMYECHEIEVRRHSRDGKDVVKSKGYVDFLTNVWTVQGVYSHEHGHYIDIEVFETLKEANDFVNNISKTDIVEVDMKSYCDRASILSKKDDDSFYNCDHDLFEFEDWPSKYYSCKKCTKDYDKL